MRVPSYDPLDEALEQLSGYGPANRNGNFNHAPMVAEALCALGRPDAVMPWVERYRSRLAPREAPGEAIDPASWREALGRRDSFAAWSAFFRAALRDAAWSDVLDLWAGRLAPGVSAAATHGAIRVGHAVRSLAAGDTPSRCNEFADALASWAASYSELPAAAAPGFAEARPPSEALTRVAILPPERRRPGNIAAALAGLVDFPEFAPAIWLADLGGDLEARLAELTELFAGLCLTNIRGPLTAIVFVHGVTSLTALGHIVPHVGEATARALLRYGWQAGCGLRTCFGGNDGEAQPADSGDVDSAAVIERALANGDEHVIKFTEACLWRHKAGPSPVYPAAIAEVAAAIAAR